MAAHTSDRVASAGFVLRLAGLAMIATSLPALGHAAGRVFKNLMLGNWGYIAPWIDYGEDDIANRVGWLALLILGVLLTRGRGRLCRHLLAPFRNACPECGYPLADIRAPNCPECGFAREQSNTR